MSGPEILAALSGPVRACVLSLARAARSAGGRALLVGGAVRDGLLGRAVKDVDIEMFGLPAEAVERLVAAYGAFDPCGLSFGVLKLRGVPVDVSLPRRESKRGEGHRGFLVRSDPSLTVAEAAVRRDFTVNALYCDPLSGAIEDPCGGLADLRARVLRHVSPKFVEDPLRVLRGMQFVARFDLAPAPGTVALCRTVGMEGLAQERLFEEWAKLLTKGVAIGRGLEFLRETGWLRHFPELERLVGCPQDPEWHPEGDVWEHTKRCLDAFAAARTGDAAEDLVVGLAVLCHDFGKPATTSVDPATKRVRSIGHDRAGEAPTLSFLRRLTNEERLLRDVPPLVREHMQIFALWRANAGDAAVRRLAVRVRRLDRLVRVGRADDAGRGPLPPGATAGGADLDWMAATAERLRVADAAPRPLFLGRHLVALGYRPGPAFGPVLAACFDAQIEGAFSDLEGAHAWFARRLQTDSGFAILTRTSGGHPR